MTADEIWDQGAAALRAQLAPATWAAWFHGVRPVEFANDVLMLSVPSSLAAERIRSSYSGMLTDAIRDVTGETVQLELLIETDVRDPVLGSPAPPLPLVDPVPAPIAARHARSRRGLRHLGLGHAQRALHLRPVRDRGVEPVRPRRSTLRGRKPRALL